MFGKDDFFQIQFCKIFGILESSQLHQVYKTLQNMEY